MKDPDIRLILDGSAVRAYTRGSFGLGETIAEVVDEGDRYGTSITALVEVLAAIDDTTAAFVRLLSTNPQCEVLDVLAADENRLTEWFRRLGSLSMAASVVEALDRPAGYLLTAEPHRYGDLDDTGLIIPI